MKNYLLILISIFTFSLENNQNGYAIRYLEDSNNNNPIIRCGNDNIAPIPLSYKNLLPFNEKDKKSKRSLDSDGFKDFNIFLDLNNFNDEIKLYHLEDKKDLFVKGMQKAIKTIQSLLKVKATKNYIFYDEDLRDILIYNWDKTKIGSEMADENIGMIDLGIDLYIFVRFGNNSELGINTLASAGPRYLDTETKQPLLGVVNINIEADLLGRIHYNILKE